MKFIFTVTFLVFLGNTYASSTATMPITSNSSTSDSGSTSTSESTTSETMDTGTSETVTTTEPTTIESTSTDTISSTETDETTTSSSSKTTETAGTTVTSSSTMTSDGGTTSTQTDNTTSTSISESTTEILSSTSTSETPSESPKSTLDTTSTSFQATTSGSLISSSVIPPSETPSSTEMSSHSSSTVESTTTLETTTANVTTELSTTEETTEESTTIEGPTSTPSTTLSPTTIIPTTLTTSHLTTTVYSINDEITLTTENAVIPLSIEVKFKNCVKEKDALANMTVEILKLDTCESIAIESADSCGNDTSQTIVFRVHVQASSVLSENQKDIIDNITATINNTESVSTAQALAYSSITACNSDVCQKALLDNKGFNCESNGANCTLTSPCRKNGTCSEHGSCYVQANGTHYLGLCKCTDDDDMYTYSGSKCENKAYSWKLWTIIASGVGGGVIVILLFAVVIQCARKKAGSFNKKYGYDSGFDDRENLMYERRYVSPDEYHRKPLSRDDDRADQMNLQSFENKGFDHWEPSDSKETYASMDRHFQDPTFQTQITRPKITTNKYSTDQLTPF